MLGYLKRLVTTGAAYQFGDIVAKGLALLTLPLYTHHLSPEAYGAAEALLTAVILSSILLRAGVGEAFIRFYFDDADTARRERIARTATASVALTTTLAALVVVAFAGPISQLLLTFEDPLLIDCAALGLWAFTNLEMAYAQLRVDERARTYVIASGANVGLTVVFTIALVVFAHQGARGLLLGNFGASAVVVIALWWVLRRRVSLRPSIPDLRAMLRFGLPTVAADASIYALQVADRFYLFRSYSKAAAGQYAVAIKLATVVLVAVRGFQYAWPPLAYSIESDREAGRLYSLVTTYYALATGAVVCGVALLGRWMVRLLAASRFFGAHRALTWLALGWALYGLYLVFVVIAGRARMTTRIFPAAATGLAVNIVLLVLLVPHAGAGLGIAGAGLALCGAYVATLLAMYLLTRRLFEVGFEWRRLAHLTLVLAAVAISGELLLPSHGAAGLLERIAWLALVPAGLLLTRFFHPHELRAARALVADGRRRVTAFRAGHGDVEAYAEDPLRDV
ncbi:MAG TPA: lipopolysaccharide biosynthesis protein [Solirubrobacteraceae bacterium]